MKQLPLELRKNGFNYFQCHRNEYKAMYAQFDGDKLVGHEVFYIKSHNGYELGGNYIEPAETYPHNEAFGVSAWSVKSEFRALKKYRNLQPITSN